MEAGVADDFLISRLSFSPSLRVQTAIGLEGGAFVVGFVGDASACWPNMKTMNEIEKVRLLGIPFGDKRKRWKKFRTVSSLNKAISALLSTRREALRNRQWERAEEYLRRIDRRVKELADITKFHRGCK